MENEIIINGVTYVKKEGNQKKQSKRDNGIWFINTDGDVLHGSNIAVDKYKPFNYPTEAEAIKSRDKQLALYRIKTYAEEKRGEFVPDWNDHEQCKYYIAYDYEEHKYIYEANYYTKKILSFYLEEAKHCNEIIEKFKDDLDILFDIKG